MVYMAAVAAPQPAYEQCTAVSISLPDHAFSAPDHFQGAVTIRAVRSLAAPYIKVLSVPGLCSNP